MLGVSTVLNDGNNNGDANDDNANGNVQREVSIELPTIVAIREPSFRTLDAKELGAARQKQVQGGRTLRNVSRTLQDTTIRIALAAVCTMKSQRVLQ